jgi:hypothetical protein
MVSSGRWDCCLDLGVCERYHPQACTGAFVNTEYGAAAVADGAFDLRKGYRASSLAHSEDGE